MKRKYLSKNFLLKTRIARKLYNKFAQKLPIFDYHCHLSEKEILEDKPFENIWEIWLKGDHYKWRLMRNYGVSEKFITGSASEYEKFCAYIRTLECAYGNPLYHWSALELKVYLGCALPINVENADKIWNQANEYIKREKLSPLKLMRKANVKIVYTTNEVLDDLTVFDSLRDKVRDIQISPAFRADRIMNIEAENYKDYIKNFEKINCNVQDFSDLEKALQERLNAFIERGTRASDIALERVYPVADREKAEEVFKRRIEGENISSAEADLFKGYMTYFLMKLYSKNNIGTELHIGAMRNNNSVMFDKLGADTGYDSISDINCIKDLSKLFDKLLSEDSLPATIVFNLNPKMNTEILTLLGCFQDDSRCGKMQYGPAWWFLDNKQGMIKHLNDLSSLSHIDTFLGMLTDSRSFFSYVRHDYFRRILCNYIGELANNGEVFYDIKTLGKTIQNICYQNCFNYFYTK